MSSIDWLAITANIEKWGWDNFCAQPKLAIVPMVLEFYANVPKHVNRKVCDGVCKLLLVVAPLKGS